MAKLEIKNWKSYKVGDLFSATRGHLRFRAWTMEKYR